MSPFENFLGGVVDTVFGGGSADVKDYQHASRLYVENSYARAPKTGFLYFVSFEINPFAVEDSNWASTGIKEVGLLVKRVDLPKFSIVTETVNQYNRKTVIQTSMKYASVNIDFHDDNSNITLNLWKNYYKYYFADSANTKGFTDTKYGTDDYAYGLNNNQNKGPFFEKIHFYILHRHKFTQITLVNPLVTEWSHDSLDQNEGNKILSNKMTVSYESVIYKEGKIQKNGESGYFATVYYDQTPSPLRTAGNGTLFGEGGVINGATDVFNSLSEGNYLGALIQGAATAKSFKEIVKNGGIEKEAYSILGGVLGDISKTGNQPGSIGSNISSQNNQNIGVGVKLFTNSSVSGLTYASPFTRSSVTDAMLRDPNYTGN